MFISESEALNNNGTNILVGNKTSELKKIINLCLKYFGTTTHFRVLISHELTRIV